MAEAAAPPAGTPCWFEINTPDVAKAKAFYGGLFGWSFKSVPMGPFDYTMIGHDGKEIGGIMPMVGEMWRGVPPHWMNTVAVDDVDASAKKAEELGGTICVPPTDLPVGRFAAVACSAGAALSRWKNN